MCLLDRFHAPPVPHCIAGTRGALRYYERLNSGKSCPGTAGSSAELHCGSFSVWFGFAGAVVDINSIQQINGYSDATEDVISL